MSKDQKVFEAPVHSRQYEAAEGRARLTLPLKNVIEPGYAYTAQGYQQPFDRHHGEGISINNGSSSFTYGF